jgi:hypothetical protein
MQMPVIMTFVSPLEWDWNIAQEQFLILFSIQLVVYMLKKIWHFVEMKNMLIQLKMKEYLMRMTVEKEMFLVEEDAALQHFLDYLNIRRKTVKHLNTSI